MRDFSLRLPYLIYLSIGSILVGVLVAPLFREMSAEDATSLDERMITEVMHPNREVPGSIAPQLTMMIEKDPMEGWNLSLSTDRFDFTPEQVGGPAKPNTGHAHLYINGAKTARLYGPHFHVPDLGPGSHEITVTLSSNDHAYYVVDGKRIEARAVIMQEQEPIIDQ